MGCLRYQSERIDHVRKGLKVNLGEKLTTEQSSRFIDVAKNQHMCASQTRSSSPDFVLQPLQNVAVQYSIDSLAWRNHFYISEYEASEMYSRSIIVFQGCSSVYWTYAQHITIIHCVVAFILWKRLTMSEADVSNLKCNLELPFYSCPWKMQFGRKTKFPKLRR